MYVSHGAAAWAAAHPPALLTASSLQSVANSAAASLQSRSSSSTATPSATPSSAALVVNASTADAAQPKTTSAPAEVDGWLLEQAHQARVKDAEVAQQEKLDVEQIQALSARDREVRAHEQAHVAVGGRYAGAPKYQYERGPDGVQYAVGGEVPISTGKEATPQETLIKAQIVRRAALAPAEPSAQDYKVAAQASRLETEARQELAELQAKESQRDPEDAEAPQEPIKSEDSVNSPHSVIPGDLATPESLAAAEPPAMPKVSESDNPGQNAAVSSRETDGSHRIAAAFIHNLDTRGSQVDRYV